MAAQPKNKITRVEQGKRRHGNTPKLLKDAKTTKVPLHKRGYFAVLMKKIGGQVNVMSTESHKAKKATKAAAKNATAAGTSAMAETAKPNLAKAANTVKKVTRTQHKGA